MPDTAEGCGKLALGTVQWGMPYGIAGRGQPDLAGVGAILATARAAGVTLLDTARAYGTAEEVIGALGAETGAMQVVTKTLPLKSQAFGRAEEADVEAALADSFTRLRRPSVHGVLVHHADNLLMPGGDRLWALLERHRAAGRIGRIGASVYNPDQCRAVLDAFPLEIVQLPFSIYDQRFLSSGVLGELKARAVEVHTRSAFLQGLLLMAPERLPPYFDALRPLHTRLHQAAGASPLAAALHFCLAQPHIDRVVVGCETEAQFKEIRDAVLAPAPAMLYSDFAITDAGIVEPSRWPK